MFTIQKQDFSSFQRNQSSTTSRDTLVTINAYDIKTASMNVTDEHGKQFNVKVSKNAIERNKKHEGYAAKYFGHLIDERMEKNLPVGTRVVLERVSHYDKGSTCTRVLSCSDQSEEKLFSGIFTIASADNKSKIVSVQSWDQTAIEATDKASLIEFAKKLEVEATSQEAHPKRFGFLLRALKANEDGSFTLVDASNGFDYIPEVKDDDGQTVEKARLIDRKFFVSACQEYGNYLKQGDVQYDKIDILTYRNYKFSVMSKHADIREQSPYFKMVNYNVVGSSNDEKPQTEKHLAVQGIISLTADEMKREGKNVVLVSRDLVTHLFANGPMEDVRLTIKSAGQTVKLSESLKPTEKKEVQEVIEEVAPEPVKQEVFYEDFDMDSLFQQ